MNRLPFLKDQGRRDILAIILLVVPLVALGYYLAVIGVAVDPPRPPVVESTTTEVATPPATPVDSPDVTATPATDDVPATPLSGATGVNGASWSVIRTGLQVSHSAY